MPHNAHLPLKKSSPSDIQQTGSSPSTTTVAQAKALWSEVLFYLALFFCFLHFAGLLLQIMGMFMHTTLKREPAWSFTSSLLSKDQAHRLLNRLVKEKVLQTVGFNKTGKYLLAS